MVFNNSQSKGLTLWTVILYDGGEVPQRCPDLRGRINQRAKLMLETWWSLIQPCPRHSERLRHWYQWSSRRFCIRIVQNSRVVIGWLSMTWIIAWRPDQRAQQFPSLKMALNFKSPERQETGLTLLLVYLLMAWLRNTLCGTEIVLQGSSRRMILQHLEMGENHMGVGTGGLRVRAPTTGFSIKSLYICVHTQDSLLGSMKTCTLQYDFSALLVPDWDL